MTQIDLSIERFKSVMKQGFARPNKFAIELPAFGGAAEFIQQAGADVSGEDLVNQAGDHARMHTTGDLNLMCKSCTLPMRSMLTNDRRIGMKSEKVTYGYGVQDVNFSFYETNDYRIRNYFETWLDRQIDLNTNEIEFKKSSNPAKGYAHDVVMHQLDPRGRVIYSVKLIDAFPIALSQVYLANDNNGIVEITITMTYTNWTSKLTPENQSFPKIVNSNPATTASPTNNSTWINPDSKTAWINPDTPDGQARFRRLKGQKAK